MKQNRNDDRRKMDQDVGSSRRQILAHHFAIATTVGVERFPVLITNLATTFAPSKLTSLHEAGIPIATNDSIVQSSAVDPLHGLQSVLTIVVLDEAKAARRLLEFVQSNDDTLYVTATSEKIINLFFGCVKG